MSRTAAFPLETRIELFGITAAELHDDIAAIRPSDLDADQRDQFRATLDGLQIRIANTLAQLPHRSADTK